MTPYARHIHLDFHTSELLEVGEYFLRTTKRINYMLKHKGMSPSCTFAVPATTRTNHTGI